MRWRSHARDYSAPQGRAAANVIRFGISFAARSIAGKMVGNGVPVDLPLDCHALSGNMTDENDSVLGLTCRLAHAG